MTVHKAISKHSENQHQRIQLFHQLEAERERYIEEAVNQRLNEQPFSVKKINDVTRKINDIATQGIVPTRKLVTVEMVEEYVEKLKDKSK
jgi:ribosomal 50S subunit-associated protein YjgA (DUF615 family)